AAGASMGAAASPGAPAAGGGASRSRQLLVAAASVVAVLVAYTGYVLAGGAVFDSGERAQAAGDCDTATNRYDLVTGPFELTLSADVARAEVNRAHCGVYTLALDEARAGRFASAVTRYHEFLNTTPANSLDEPAHAGLRQAYLDWAAQERRDKAFPRAIDAYRELVREYPDSAEAGRATVELAATYFEQAADYRAMLTPTDSPVDAVRGAMEAYLLVAREFPASEPAAQVPQALADTFAEAMRPFAAGMFCESLPALDYLTDLPPAESAGVVELARGNHARAGFECGVIRYGTGDYDEALNYFEAMATTYPDHPSAAAAGSAVVAATIAAAGATPAPALPPPLAGNSPGSILLTLYNDSSSATEVLITGATAHRVTLDACGSCPAEYATAAEACRNTRGLPSIQLRLRPGNYHMLSRYPGPDGGRPYLSTIDILSGYTHTSCFYVGPPS
ncbi:MAG TPA: tetratricopeptide repeat protein, partial [Pseudonocardiaceae bacterium]